MVLLSFGVHRSSGQQPANLLFAGRWTRCTRVSFSCDLPQKSGFGKFDRSLNKDYLRGGTLIGEVLYGVFFS
jgi:hypothetical protein